MSQDEWCSGPDVTVPLAKFFHGPVGLDPCSNERSIVRAKRTYCAGGLALPWDAPTIYKNEPYSRLAAWAEKTVAELAIPYRGKRKELVGLEPVCTSAEWWDITVAADPLLVFTKRLSFIDENGIVAKSGARFDSVFTVWANKRREAEFLRLFAPVVRFATRGKDWRRFLTERRRS